MKEKKPLFKIRATKKTETCILEMDCGTLSKEQIDSLIIKQNNVITMYDAKINKLTCHADKWDYMLATSSGLICGIIGATAFSTNISFENIHLKGSEKVSNSIINRARKEMAKDPNCDLSVLEGDGALEQAVSYFEKTKSVGDIVKDSFGGGNHHFYDFTHDNSLNGLIASIKSQFTGKVEGIDPTTGLRKTIEIVGFNPDLPPNRKLFKAIMNWSFHIASDACGTSSTIAKHVARGERASSYGTGVPGPILSVLKKLGSSKWFEENHSNPEFMKELEDLFFNKKFDYRSEVGLASEVAKMSIPILMNQIFVSFYYFIRRFATIIINEKVNNLNDALKAAKRSLPFGNRTIHRLLTVSSSAMLACNLSSAAIKSGGTWAGFFARINYVGVANFTISWVTEGIDVIRLEHNKKKQINEINEYIKLLNAKTEIMYKDVWVNIEKTDKSLEEVSKCIEWINMQSANRYIELKDDLDDISNLLDKMDDNLKSKMIEELEKE